MKNIQGLISTRLLRDLFQKLLTPQEILEGTKLMPSFLLFVYGSLRQEMSAHDLMNGSTFLKTTQTAPLYSLRLFEGFPGLGSGSLSIVGELYNVPEEEMLRLDEYEDVPHLYQRREVILEDQSVCVSYFLTNAFWKQATTIDAKDWKEYLSHIEE